VTEMMKRYEAETGKCATWTWHERKFLTDDYIAWIEYQLRLRHQKESSMRKLGEQWVEEFDGKKHMLKAMENTTGGCKGCDLQVVENCYGTCGAGDGCNFIIKDLGILNEDGLLPCPFCGKYPRLIKPEYGYQRLERPSRNGYTYECGCGVICGWDYDYGGTHQTEQEAKDAWNRRA